MHFYSSKIFLTNINLGQRPHENKQLHEVINFVCYKKGCLKIPSICPPALSRHLLLCWKFNPMDRPTFETLLNVITREVLSKPSRRHSYLELTEQ